MKHIKKFEYLIENNRFKRFKIGDNVVCVNTKGTTELTLGKKYKIIGIDFSRKNLEIKNDSGELSSGQSVAI